MLLLSVFSIVVQLLSLLVLSVIVIVVIVSYRHGCYCQCSYFVSVICQRYLSVLLLSVSFLSCLSIVVCVVSVCHRYCNRLSLLLF